jgi:YD repeat-containing protein
MPRPEYLRLHGILTSGIIMPGNQFEKASIRSFMKTSLFLFSLFLLLSACGSEPSEVSTPEYTAPPDPGLAMYRTAMFSADWRLQPMNQISWDTALHIPAVAVSRDAEGRIIEASGFWRGRRSDNVLVADYPPLLRFAYEGNTETVSFHYADGSPFPIQGAFAYRVTRTPESGTTVLEFTGEDRQMISIDQGIRSIRFVTDSVDGEWITRMLCDSAGTPVSLPGVMQTRYLLDSSGNVLAIEGTDNQGNRVPIMEGIFRLEMSCDSSGNIIERKKLDENGISVLNPDSPGWQTYEVSESGLVQSSMVLDSTGEPSVDNDGSHRTEFSYDEFGRIISRRSYDPAGEPLVTSGAWDTVTEFDDLYLQSTQRRFAPGGELVEIDGIATTLTQYDSLGNITDISVFNAAGEPARDNQGVHSCHFVYGEHSRRLEMQIWEPSGEPGVSTRGYHIERYIYDEEGNLTATELFDAEGRPL